MRRVSSRPLRRRSALLAALGAIALVLPLFPAGAAAVEPVPDSKLRSDLAAIVATPSLQHAQVAALAGFPAGRIGYFAVIDGPITPARRARIIEGGDTRVLRRYYSVSAFALASTPADVLRVAGLPFVERLSPIELTKALDHQQEAGQLRGTPRDVGAVPWWNAGITGRGIRIAVLDTGTEVSHPDLDDRDFRHWSAPGTPKLIDSRNFNGAETGGATCAGPGSGSADGHGHGTHVAGIATGTGEGAPAAGDNGRYTGIAPDARLAVGKVLTDAGAGVNSDLLAALEWAAMPVGAGSPTCPSIGADVVNLSLGSEARSNRLNTGADIDMVSFVANHLAVRYGTLIVAAAGNSGPFIGSVLESPGSASQVLSVSASSKDYDLNHDDTASGDACSGYQHPDAAPATPPSYDGCEEGVGTQRRSISSFSSRGPAGDLWLRPDVSAPGYNIVSVQAAGGSALHANDLSPNTRDDPVYSTATGTSMASPAAAGTAALLLNAYRAEHGADPIGISGIAGVPARAYVLLRAALMNTALADQFEARWITNGFQETVGPLILKDLRNGPADPYVGPFAEGAGKIHLGSAIQALRDGVVMYSAVLAREDVPNVGTGPADFQGTWQIGAIDAGRTRSHRFVLHAAPGVGPVTARFSLIPGHPSDGSRPLPVSGPGAWSFTVPGPAVVPEGGDAIVRFSVTIPASATPGSYTGRIRVRLSTGRELFLPVHASVALRDQDHTAGNEPGPQASVTSAQDVYATGTTVWPSVAGQANGSASDWLVHGVRLDGGLGEAVFRAWDPAGLDTYDLYLYDQSYGLVASTHPFAAPDTTDTTENDSRGPSTAAAPQELALDDPAGGRYFLVVSRAKKGSGSPLFGSFVLTHDAVVASP